MASTTREALPVAAVEEREFGEPGERTLQARDLLRTHIEESLAG